MGKGTTTQVKQQTGQLRMLRLGRRGFLGAAAASGLGVASAMLVGCGDDDDDEEEGTTPTPTVGSTASPQPSPASSPIPTRGGTLRLPIVFSNGHFDIHQFVIRYQFSIWRAAAQGLFVTEPGSGNTVGSLARDWEYPDDLTFLVHMHENAVFQNLDPVNGRAVSADDAKFSFERLSTDSADFPRHSDYREVDQIDVLDDHTLRFVMKRPYAPLINLMTNDQAVVVPPEVVAKFGDLKSPEAIIGSGPFIAESVDGTTGARLVRNPDYWVPDRPYLDAVELTIVNDTQTSFSAFRAGEFDMHDVAAIDLPSVENDDDLTIEHYISPSWMVAGLGGPVDTGPLQDKRVREAIDLAIDRQALGRVVYPGGDFELSSVFAHPNWSLPTSELLDRPGFRDPKDADIAEARRLADAAGNPSLTIQTTPDYPSFHIDRAQVYQAQLQDAGFDVTIELDEYAAYKEKERNKRFMLSTLALGFYGDPDAPLSGAFGADGARNYFSWFNAEYERLLEKEQSEFDPEIRKDTVLEAQRFLLEERPVAAFNAWFVYADIAVRNYVRGARFGATSPSGSNAGEQGYQFEYIWLDK